MRYARLSILFLFTTAVFFACRKDPQESISINNSYGGSRLDLASAIVRSSDGGFIVVGATQSTDRDLANAATNLGGSTDAWIFKVDESGQMLWSRKLGGSGTDLASQVAVTADGGCVVAGSSENADGDVTDNSGGKDAWIIKLDKNGRVQWKKNFGGSGDDLAHSIIQDVNGDYVFAGSSSLPGLTNTGVSDLWVIKLTSEGILTWTKHITGNEIGSIINSPDGGYLVTGDTESSIPGYHSNKDIMVVKLASDGSLVWQKAFGGSGSDHSSSVAPSLSGGFVVAGTSTSSDGDLHRSGNNADNWLFEINNLGNIIWERSYETKETEGPADILVNSRGYSIAGTVGFGTRVQSVVTTIDAEGKLITRKMVEGYAVSQAQLAGRRCMILGNTTSTKALSAKNDVQIFTVDL